MEGGGFPAPHSSPLIPPLTDGQQQGTLFSCQSAFPANLSRSVTDEPRNSKNALGVARRFPDVHRLSPKRPGITLGTKPLHAALRWAEVAAWRAMGPRIFLNRRP